MAWQRTGLGLLGVGALLLHGGDRGPTPLLLAAGLLNLVCGALLMAVVAPLRYRRTLSAVGNDRTPVARYSCAATAVCAVVSAAAAAGAIVAAI